MVWYTVVLSITSILVQSPPLRSSAILKINMSFLTTLSKSNKPLFNSTLSLVLMLTNYQKENSLRTGLSSILSISTSLLKKTLKRILSLTLNLPGKEPMKQHSLINLGQQPNLNLNLCHNSIKVWTIWFQSGKEIHLTFALIMVDCHKLRWKWTILRKIMQIIQGHLSKGNGRSTLICSKTIIMLWLIVLRKFS